MINFMTEVQGHFCTFSMNYQPNYFKHISGRGFLFSFLYIKNIYRYNVTIRKCPLLYVYKLLKIYL